ncbi:PAS domain-containing sensor histidine kinase [Sphingomonas parva]|nr:PAS domain-containing sensor histidine kinase [Sphingomonas parva]
MGIEAQDRATTALCAAAGACAGLVLTGWAIDAPALTGFGSPLTAQPLTAVAFLVLTAAMLFALAERKMLATLLAVVPALIGASALFQEIAGVALGTDTLLFADRVTRQALPEPGRPSTAVALGLLLLSGGAVAATRKGLRMGQTAAVLAITGFGAIAVAGAALPLAAELTDPAFRYVAAPLPAMICGVLLAIALLGWRGSVWEGLLAGLGLDRTLLQVVLPLLVVTPVAAEWIEERAKGAGLDPVVAGSVETGLNIAAMAALLLWVTSRAAREQRARRALTRALDSAPIALTDTSGLVIHWSKGCEQLYGWGQAEARGRRKYDLLASATGQDESAAWPSGSAGWEGELIERKRDGSTVNILERARLLEPRHGGDPVFVLSMTDITARTQAEAALRESEARLTLAMDTNDIGIIEWDAVAGRFTQSRGAGRSLGLAEGGISSLADWRARIDPADRAALFSRINNAIARQQPRIRFRHRFVRPDGSKRMLETSAACFYDAAGKLTRLICVYIDVTEKEEWESRLAQLQDEVMHVSRLSAMGEMASGLAHELNQPLTAVVNFLGTAKVLRATGDDSKLDDLLAAASQQALRAGQIIRRLRTFVSRGTVQEEWTSIGELIEDSIALALASRGRNDVDLRIETEDPDQLVCADRVQIQQVLVNLLRNAAEALDQMPPERREIVVTSAIDGDPERLLVSVQDNGPGLPKEMLDSLFTPFVSGKEGGMGVGLSICKRIVEAHGGTLRAENNQHGGATFRFTLQTRPGDDEV